MQKKNDYHLVEIVTTLVFGILFIKGKSYIEYVFISSAGCDIRSIFKGRKADLNSEFSLPGIVA